MLLAVEWGRVGEYEQEGKVAQAKRERRICPRVLAPLAKVVSSSTRNSFWLNSSGLVTWGLYDEIGPE